MLDLFTQSSLMRLMIGEILDSGSQPTLERWPDAETRTKVALAIRKHKGQYPERPITIFTMASLLAGHDPMTYETVIAAGILAEALVEDGTLCQNPVSEDLVIGGDPRHTYTVVHPDAS